MIKRERRNRTHADVTLALRELIRAELAHEQASAADQARARELEARLQDARERYNRLVGAA